MTNGLDGVRELDGVGVLTRKGGVGVLRAGESTQDVSRIKVNRSATNLRFTNFLQTIDAGILPELAVKSLASVTGIKGGRRTAPDRELARFTEVSYN